jgi:kynureninase
MNEIPALLQKYQLSSAFSSEFALKLDEADELKHMKNEFLFPKTKDPSKRPIYLCGNSLGLQPKNLRTEVCTYLDKWADEAVEGHFLGDDLWVEAEGRLKSSMAKIVGAKESEVVIMNTLTVNLHLMMVSFYKPTQQRHKIMIEKKAFPSDYHAVITQIQFHGFIPETSLIEVEPREGELCLRDEDIEAIIEREGEIAG